MDKSFPLIAIVDDISDNVRILHHCLKDEQYRFGIAQSAQDLYTLLETQIPHVILLDIMMPGEDGFTILKKLKQDACYADIPVIFVTARANPEDLVQGFKLGGVDYITKPFNPAEVRARVRTHVEARSALERERKLNKKLHAALERVRTLEGIIPICSQCKAVRSDQGYWTEVEKYISAHTDALFSHSLCPNCADTYFSKPLEIKTEPPQKKESPCKDA